MDSRDNQFQAALASLFGETQAEEVCHTMRAPKRQAVWRNPLRAAAYEPFQELAAGLGFLPVPGFTDLWSVSQENRGLLNRSDLVSAGALYPVNPSSIVAAKVLAPPADAEVLDLAAAPGGKTLVLAAQMDNGGRIAAIEPVKGRFFRMQANLKRCGVTNVAFYQSDGRAIGHRTGARFDCVLLDAPCSSEARVRLAEPETLEHWSPRKIRETSRKQKRLLLSAFTALKPGGRLLYCTCAFSYAENESVVGHLLRRESTAQVLPLGPEARSMVPEQLARPGFVQDPGGKGKVGHASLSHALRIMPDDLWDGFFICVLTKREGV